MNVLVDTSIWSLALRRGATKDPIVTADLSELIGELRVQMIGPIRQELLSGIKSENQFEELRSYLSAFPDLPLETVDFERAAEFFNICRRNGVQGSNTDFLICSVAHSRGLEIFTSDDDFLAFRRRLPIRIYSPRTGV
ncbi:MAG: PIN domain-containing protein [Chloroflexi bacterium]|nr:PIN domain-containing protein [Chloroflexota bacterium]